MDTITEMFGPLNFEEKEDSALTLFRETPCLLCEDKFNLKIAFQLFLKHIFEVHYLVIEDVQNIINIESYVVYWKKRFNESSVDYLLPAIKIDSTDQCYFLLSTLLKEDKELRHKFKLEAALQQQEFERTDMSYKLCCLFCRLDFEGTRCDYIKHLSAKHNLHLGKPENLVYISELVKLIENKLNKLQCIYCEKTFPERNVLKEHMRKKLHKRINPANSSYDKFYIVNYLEEGKNWQHIEKEDDCLPISADDSDQEWEDWNEDEELIVCLFCNTKQAEINKLCEHMKEEHEFDFQESTAVLDFYQKIKLVNFIRRQIHGKHCVFCNEYFATDAELKTHLKEEKHIKLPELNVYDRPEYYFPTYENDVFLYFLEEINE